MRDRLFVHAPKYSIFSWIFLIFLFAYKVVYYTWPVQILHGSELSGFVDYRCILRLSPALGLGIMFPGYIGRSFVRYWICMYYYHTDMYFMQKSLECPDRVCRRREQQVMAVSRQSIQFVHCPRNQPTLVNILGSPLDSDFGAGDRQIMQSIIYGARTHAIVEW